MILKKFKIYLIIGGIAAVGILWIISLNKAVAYGEDKEANKWMSANAAAVSALQAELKEARAKGRENVNAAEKRAQQAQNEANQRIRKLLEDGQHATLETCRNYRYPDEYINALWLRD